MTKFKKKLRSVIAQILYSTSGLVSKLIGVGILPTSLQPFKDWLVYTSFEFDDDASLGEWVSVSDEEKEELRRILEKHQ